MSEIKCLENYKRLKEMLTKGEKGDAGRVASRTLGVVGAAVAIADFGDCMGWYNIW